MVSGYLGGEVVPVVKTNAHIADDFAKWIMSKKDVSEVGAGEYLRRWYAESSDLLQDINSHGPEPLAGFAYTPGKWIPLTLGDKNGSPALLVTSLRGKYEYNTARQRESEVASNVVQTIVLPVEKTIARHFREKQELQFYGVVVTYGVRNFVSEAQETQHQTLCIVSPAKSCIRYTDLEITDAQLIRESDAYVLSGGELRKVEIAPL